MFFHMDFINVCKLLMIQIEELWGIDVVHAGDVSEVEHKNTFMFKHD